MADIEKLIIALKRAQPASIKVYDAADNVRHLAVSQGHKKRWAGLVTNITSQSWIRAVFLDKAGLELGHFDNEGAATDVEQLTSEATVAGTLREERLLRIMLDAQKTALSYRDQETKDLLAGVRELLTVGIDVARANAEGMRQLAQLYQAQVSVATDVAAMQAAAEHGGDIEQWLKVLEAAPESIAKLAPVLQVLLGSRRALAPAKKPNGANGTTTNGVTK